MIATETPAVDAFEMPVAPRSLRGQPVWGLALLYPAQGHWTEEEYLALNTNRIVELSDGCIEVHPMATLFHQFIAQYLFKLLDEFVTSRKLGAALIAPVPVRLVPGTMREPDVFFLRPGRYSSTRRPPDAADLVMEVVSEGKENRERDLVTKKAEYAEAGIAEYWIVDPENQTITVLALDERLHEYEVRGEYRSGSRAVSSLLPDFSVDVSATFAAGDGPAKA